MTEPLKKGQKYYPGIGTTLPTDKVDRQLALQELMRKREKAEERLHNKIAKRYVEPGESKGTSKAQ